MLELIGNTPMVKLNNISESACPIIVKNETTNPGGSSKDRPALAMIKAAEESGELKPGGTIIEPTSGNTGVGLAIVAAQRGYKCKFVVTDKVGKEKVDLLKAYGAEVIVCPVAVKPEDPTSYYSVAERLVEETPNAYRPNQYHNPVNPQAHFETTGPEIWEQTEGKVTHFVTGAGTGGTLSGVGKYLKSQNPDIQIVAADPEGSVFSGGSGRPYLVEGVGEDFWPTTYDQNIADIVIPISDEQSFITARMVTEQEGMLIGGSGGTAMAAAIQIAGQLTAEDMVVVLIPDSGRGYLSTVFNDDWMAGYGFLEAASPTVGDVLKAKDRLENQLVYVQPADTLRMAIKLMHEHEISQVPVAKGPMPLANAEVIGSLDELKIMEAVFKDSSLLDKASEELMGERIPTIGIGQSVSMAISHLETNPALLVLDGGRPRSIIARSDLLSFLSK